jgi:hypothetical protein
MFTPVGRVSPQVPGGIRIRGEPAAVAVLLSVLALGACASAPPSRPAGFDPPLSAGMAREYANDFETVLNAARAVAAWGPHNLFSEETVDSSTVVFRTRFREPSLNSSVRRGDARVVVQSLAPGRTVVRVHWPAAAMFQPGSDAENLIFGQIEFRLKQVG